MNALAHTYDFDPPTSDKRQKTGRTAHSSEPILPPIATSDMADVEMSDAAASAPKSKTTKAGAADLGDKKRFEVKKVGRRGYIRSVDAKQNIN